MLTKETVIAIAAAVFVLFNIVWLTAIRKKNKAKPPEAPSGDRGSSPNARPGDPSDLTLDDEDEDYGEDASKEPRKLPEDFVIEENIVWIHTKEKL